MTNLVPKLANWQSAAAIDRALRGSLVPKVVCLWEDSTATWIGHVLIFNEVWIWFEEHGSERRLCSPADMEYEIGRNEPQ